MEASDSFSELVGKLCSWIPRRVEATASTPTMSRAFWMPDRSCRYCFECESPFSLFNRRHHCRRCGKVFCGKCSLNTIPASVEEGAPSVEGERVRVCNFCYKRQGQDSTPPNEPPLSPSSSGRSMENSALGPGGSAVPISPQQTASGGSSDRPPYVWDEAQDASSEKEQAMRDHQGGLPPSARDHPSRPYRFENRSDDEEDDDEKQQDSEHRDSELQDPQDDDEDDSCVELIEDQRDRERKSDSSLYSSQSSNGHNPLSDDGSESRREEASDGKSSSEGLEEGGDDDTPMYEGAQWTVDETVHVDYESNSQVWIPPAAGDDQDDEDDDDDVGTSIVDDDDEDDEGGGWGVPRSPGSVSSMDIKKDKTASDEHRKAMRAQVACHFRNLVSQLLQREYIDVGDPGNPESWLEIVSSISMQAASLVKPDTSKGGGMDPGGYVKVKCIASGRPSDSVVIKGIVFRRNVAHKRMISRYKNPRLLLLGGALEYQRVPNQLSSLDTLLQQERDHLSMTVARIEAHHPNVLLVEKAVSGFAQEILLNKEITLVYNVKRRVLDRIARCVGGQVVPSPDNLVAPKAVHCESFHVEKFVEEHGAAGSGGKQSNKFLMFFEGCPKPLGCTVLLKGANGDYLKKVKHVVQLAVFSAYHLALETSFLADEGATLPEFPSKLPTSVPPPNKHSISDTSLSSGSGFLPAVPGQAHQAKTTHSAYLSTSPLPSRTNSISTAAFNNVDHLSTGTNMVPFSASSSCVSSATNSPGTSPAQTSIGFHSGYSRTASLGGTTTTSHYRMSNGVYPGGKSWQGVSGLSVSLRREKADGSGQANNEGSTLNGGNGSLTSEVKALDMNNVGGSHLSNRDKTMIIASMVSKGSTQEGHDEHHVVPEEVQDHLQVLIQNSWHPEQLCKEDFPPSPSDHLSILVQLSSRCLTKGTVCKAPHFLRIKYYGNADKPLGRFLRDSLFDTTYNCRDCEEPGDAHVHCFTHRQGSLTISVRRLKPEAALSGERDGRIWMWHRCLRCPPVNGVPPATPRVIMSDAAWGLSFGKFLELSFSTHPAASRVAACGHSLHRDCLRFYGFGSMVACFRYAQINLHSVYLPPLRLEFNSPHEQNWLQREVDEVAAKANLVFSDVVNRLRVLGEKVASSRVLYGSSSALDAKRRIVALETLLQKEKFAFEEALQRAAPAVNHQGQGWADILELNWLRRELFIRLAQWNWRLGYLDSKSLPFRKRVTGSIDDPSFLSSRELNITNGSMKLPESQVERDSLSSDVISHLQRSASSLDSHSGSNVGSSQSAEQNYVPDESREMQLSMSEEHNANEVNNSHNSSGTGLDFRLEKEILSPASGNLLENLDHDSRRGPSVSKSVLSVSASRSHASGNLLENLDHDSRRGPSVSKLVPSVSASALKESRKASDALVSHSSPDLGDHVFSATSPGCLEGEITARRALSEGNFPLLADLSDTLEAAWTGEGGSTESQSAEKLIDTVNVNNGHDSKVGGLLQDLPSEVQPPSEAGPAQEGDISTQDRSTLSDVEVSPPSSPSKSDSSEDLTEQWMGAPFTTFVKGYSLTSSNISNSSDPKWPPPGLPSIVSHASQLAADGGVRVFLPLGHDDVVVGVYDDQPTSVIAYAISTEEHFVHVTDIRAEKDKTLKEKDQEKDLDHINLEHVVSHPLQAPDILGDGDVSDSHNSRTGIENPLTSTKASQMVKKTIHFGEDTAQGKVKFQVTCYFAKQFDALRKKCCMGNTEYIRSLCRCQKWGAQGGKSNVFFAKTADDRFVVKQATRTELNSFLEFAPAYFKYLSDALTTGNPTCLAKIFGVYEVKITKGGKEIKKDLLVMENLLYGRHITRLYDLKGSKRSRYNADSTGKNQVLLDQNLLEAMPTNPIFVGNKSKRLLERAVWNDTHFLSLVFVMDYSLLVGVDEERQELVVGIIDFIRQYTWDKHLETWVKASGFLGGPKDAPPTVISPKQYKKRFRKAMSTYFLMVPDQWMPPQLTVPHVVDTVEDHSISYVKGEDVPDDTDTPQHLSSH